MSIKPVARMESPNQAIRLNCEYKVIAPQTVAWPVNLYAAQDVSALVRQLRSALTWEVGSEVSIWAHQTRTAIAAADEFLKDQT